MLAARLRKLSATTNFRKRGGIWLVKGNRGYDEPSGGYNYQFSYRNMEQITDYLPY